MMCALASAGENGLVLCVRVPSLNTPSFALNPPRVLHPMASLHLSDRAHLRRGQEQGQHHLPGNQEGHHFAEGCAHQKVCPHRTDLIYGLSDAV